MNKLKAITTIFCLVSIFSSKVYSQVFNEQKIFAQAGFGFGSPYFANESTSSFPPIHFSAEYGITKNIGVGGMIGFAGSRYKYSDILGRSYQWTYRYFIIGARGAYHYDLNEKTDLYGGLMLGANISSTSFKSNFYDESLVSEPKAGGVILGLYGGARYMFTDDIGAFAELGYNISWLSFGVTLNIN
jgi:hypothetical protein